MMVLITENAKISSTMNIDLPTSLSKYIQNEDYALERKKNENGKIGKFNNMFGRQLSYMCAHMMTLIL